MGPGCSPLKADKEARLMERKLASFWMLATGREVGRTDAYQRLTPPLLTDSQWARAFRQKEGTTRRTSTVSSDSHLEIGCWRAAERHHDDFKHS